MLRAEDPRAARRGGGKVRAKVVDKRRKKQLHALVTENIESGSNLYSDALKSYDGLSENYVHQVIDHAEAYVDGVDGQVHTNNCENSWSLLKRGIHGTYVNKPYHLFRYVDDQAFRYNMRKDQNDEPLNDGQRFDAVLSQLSGKRLTWKGLTGTMEGGSPIDRRAGSALLDWIVCRDEYFRIEPFTRNRIATVKPVDSSAARLGRYPLNTRMASARNSHKVILLALLDYKRVRRMRRPSGTKSFQHNSTLGKRELLVHAPYAVAAPSIK